MIAFSLWCARRVASGILVVAGIAALTFVLVHLAPGDPVYLLAGDGGSLAYYQEMRAKYGLASRFVVGWVGVLRRWHGLEVLLRAARESDASVLVVGDGPDRPEIERMVDSLDLGDRVRITGRIPHHEVPEHIAAFDVAVAADDRTGFASPMKVVEYMAMGRAVVVPRLTNFLDLVRDGVSGVVFEPGDSSDLARRLVALRGAPDLRRQLGRTARQEVESRLNWKENARKVLSALKPAAVGEAPRGSRSPEAFRPASRKASCTASAALSRSPTMVAASATSRSA